MTPMTKLGEEMFLAIHGFGPVKDNTQFDSVLRLEAEAAAEVAKRYIEKALNDGLKHGRGGNPGCTRLWLMKNGILKDGPIILIEQLNLSARPYRLLKELNIHTVTDLHFHICEHGVVNIRGFGKKCQAEIEKKLSELGYAI